MRASDAVLAARPAGVRFREAPARSTAREARYVDDELRSRLAIAAVAGLTAAGFLAPPAVALLALGGLIR